MTTEPRNKQPLVLYLIIILGTILRVATIGRDSLWLDEAISMLTARLPLSAILDNSIQDPHPPLYYLLLHGWRLIVPETDGWLRGLSAFWGVLLIPALYALALASGRSRREAQVAALLVALSPFQIFYSHELRMYTLLMLLVTLTVWAYVRARPQTGYGWWFLFTVLAAAALYTHLFAAMTLLAIGLYALLYHRERQALWLTFGAGIVIGLLFLPWLQLMLVEQSQDGGSLRPLLQTFTFNPIIPLTAPTFLLFGQSSTLIYSGLALFLTLALLVVLVMDGRKGWREESASGLLLPVLVVVLTLGIPLVVYFMRPFFLPERTMAAAAPLLLLLLAWGTTRRGGPLPYLVGGAAALMLVGTFIYLSGEAQKPPCDAVMTYVASQRQPGDAVLHTSDGSYLPALTYVDWSQHALLAGDPDPRKAEVVYEIFGGQLWARDEIRADRLWLIVALEHSEDWQLAQVAYFETQFHRVETHNIGGIEIYLYERLFAP
jgi:4-amino-4-deoxy-L-arabinose transferase-like glycosyltransferase